MKPFGKLSESQILSAGHRLMSFWHAPSLTIPQILAWADAHHRRTEKWPARMTGRIPGALGESWLSVDTALKRCGRGLHIPGMSLARLLAEHRDARNQYSKPKLSVKQIIDWARAHCARTNRWPWQGSGPILESPKETWAAVNYALREGSRGLECSERSLPDLLAKHCGTRNHMRLPPLKFSKVLAWARAYHRRTGHWPHKTSGPIRESPGETWHAVEGALRRGSRGLPGGSNLYRLLLHHYGVRQNHHRPELAITQIIAWAKAHVARWGSLPAVRSGKIAGTAGESWGAINNALRLGYRGLPGGTSLPQLLRKRFPRKYWPKVGRRRCLAREPQRRKMR